MRGDRGRIVQYPWITNVLKRLLDVRQGQLPGGFEDSVYAIFDASRRDPELLKEIGITPFATHIFIPAVAAEFSLFDLAVADGFIVVIDRIVVTPSANVVWSLHWSNTALTAPSGVPLFGLDMRLGMLSIGGSVGLTVSADSAGAVPGNRFWLGRALANAMPPVGPPPIVLSETDSTGNHFQLFNETVNTSIDVFVSGYGFREQR